MKRLASILLILFSLPVFLQAKTRYSLAVSYGAWTLNPVKSALEGLSGDVLKEVAQDRIADAFSDRSLGPYSQNISLDAKGGGYSVQLRIFPRGDEGSFSLGFTYTRIEPEIVIDGVVRQDFTSGEYLDMNAQGKVKNKYSAFLMDLRWEFFPSSSVTPYFSIGGGFSPLKGTAKVTGEGISHLKSGDELYEANEERELKEIDAIPISFIPVVMMNLGLKAELTREFSLFADFGVWNGFILNAGAAFSF